MKRQYLWLTLGIAAAALIWGAITVCRWVTPFEGNAAWVKIPPYSTAQAVTDSVYASLGPDFGAAVVRLLDMDNADHLKGAYKILPGDRAFRVARRINTGHQTPVKVTFNNIRTLPQFASRVSARLNMAPDSLLAAINRAAIADSITVEEITTQLLPDTYEMFWTVTPDNAIKKIRQSSQRFWTPARLEGAKKLGLTPAQTVILASIVEEETNSKEERPQVARLYLNRLQRGMALQADPTVKFATGHFAARRITGDMLRTLSPYNTYQTTGLPPGPIRLVEPSAIDAVLAAPNHDYLYMCASPDFSGRHIFAKDFLTHSRNAASYRQALNRRNIHE